MKDLLHFTRAAKRWLSPMGLAASVVLLSSCATEKKYDLAHSGGSSQDSILIIEATPTILPIAKVDDVRCSLSRATVSSTRMRFAEIRLVAGPHKMKVTFNYLSGNCLAGRYIPFVTLPGKTYRLDIKVNDLQPGFLLDSVNWTPKIVEVETAKEFLPDPGSFKVDLLRIGF